ncbi:DUF4244 domain-containing protein [Corynebacterium mendelii]
MTITETGRSRAGNPPTGSRTPARAAAAADTPPAAGPSTGRSHHRGDCGAHHNHPCAAHGSTGGTVLQARSMLRQLATDQRGMTTIEYAMCTLAAAALAAVLYGVVTSETMATALQDIIDKALNSAPL